MIYYFSGTGNSEWVAKQIAARTGDTAVNIADLLKSGRTEISFDVGQSVGIVFPIYAWLAPKPVVQFVKGLKIAKGVYCYAVCTCGDEAGIAMKRFSKFFPLDSAWSIAMPNNYIRLFNLDSTEKARNKVKIAKEKIPTICEVVRMKQKVWNVHKGPFAHLKSYVINPLFNMVYMSASGFKAENNCTSCGLCAKVCPMGNITLMEGQPIWGDHCTQCMACIHRCPVQAVQYGNNTQKKGRYTFKEI